MARVLAAAALVLGLLPGGMAQADSALLVGNARYSNLPNLQQGRSVRTADAALRQAGFDVQTLVDVPPNNVLGGLSEILLSEEDERIVITLLGHFVHSADGETWYLGTIASRPNRASVEAYGVPLSAVMAVAAQAPGRAVVVLGTVDASLTLGPGLAPGVAMPEPPQGVAVFLTDPLTATSITRDQLPQDGLTLAEIAASHDNLQSSGFVTDLVAFSGDLGPVGGAPSADPVGDAEDDLWAAVSELNTEGAYISYLRQYPTGRYASQARAAFEALRDPLRIASEQETALSLSRADRRSIQSDLTVLGFDTRGIDGIFGNGTRAAIRDWQASVGLDETGYLTRTALRRLASAAADRRAEIEAEEAILQAERERLDRAFWTATGQGQDAPGIRAYLSRYPDGLYSEVASARLAEIEEVEGRALQAAEEDAWSFAERQDNVGAYRGYLAAYPQGNYAREAQNRIAELRGQPLPFPEINTAELEAAEAALNLPAITRLLIERRLDSGGYEPGAPDGRFDDRTRAAIAAFQDDNGLTATGYLDQRTLSRFLSDGIQIILR